jgi:epoxide hydrolase-like predicted phosphatase
MAVKAMIFDGGGVLTTSVTACFASFERAFGLPQDSLLPVLREPRDDGGEPDFYELERGRMTEADFWSRLPSELEARLGVRIDLPRDVDVLRSALWGEIRSNDRMLAVVRAVSTQYKTALLTNGVREWVHLRNLCCPELFDVVVDSCELGLRKPEPAIYEVVCARLGVRPQEAVFFDDIPANVLAARAIGILGILFETTDQAIRQLSRHLPEAL